MFSIFNMHCTMFTYKKKIILAIFIRSFKKEVTQYKKLFKGNHRFYKNIYFQYEYIMFFNFHSNKRNFLQEIPYFTSTLQTYSNVAKCVSNHVWKIVNDKFYWIYRTGIYICHLWNKKDIYLFSCFKYFVWSLWKWFF